MALNAVVLDCVDVAELSGFYLRLLGWRIHHDGGADWVDIISPTGGAKLAFQRNEHYVPPVWPERQQQMAHVDFTVADNNQMDQAIAHALACGATLPDAQFGGALWTTLLDPAGHPFCFVIW